MQPTSQMYGSLQTAYDFFNHALFESTLPSVIFTVQRKKGVMGYFAPDRWGHADGKKCHEIAINPSYIANSRLIEVMQTLVHEMVHCWQYCFGKPGRDYYHNKEWAMKMIEIGLMPSSTGEPGGAIVGQQMSDYILKNGKFFKSFNKLCSDDHFQLAWIDRKALPRLFDPVIAEPSETSGTKNEVKDNAALTTRKTNEIRELTGVTSFEPYHDGEQSSYSEMFPGHFVTEDRPQRKTRYRYICYGCYAKVYGKPKLQIQCMDCSQMFECEQI